MLIWHQRTRVCMILYDSISASGHGIYGVCFVLDWNGLWTAMALRRGFVFDTEDFCIVIWSL